MKYYVVDAFTDELFKGNPAGVCLLEKELPGKKLQQIAFENNLAETAFLLKKNNLYYLRWFTPDVEVDLCGHATLATAFVLMELMGAADDWVSFETQSGTLTVTKSCDIYTMDFPRRKPSPVEIPELLEKAIGCRVLGAYLSRDLIVRVETEEEVRALHPNIEMIKKINSSLGFALVVTAQGVNCDFVSRFFAPNAGVVEDPVTGSSHSSLIPFWSELLNKTKMTARQLSRRGGTLFCEDNGGRVKIGGKAVCYFSGEIKL